MKKRIVVTVLSAMMVLSMALTGCSGNSASTSGNETAGTSAADDTTADSSTENGEDVVLTFCWWGNQTRNDLTTQAVELYNETHEGVTVEVEFADWTGYWDKLAAEAASKDLPDIFQQDSSYLQTYYASGLMANLDPYIEDGTIDTTNIEDSILDLCKVDGSVYGMSMGTNCLCMLYNPEIVEQAGVTIPDRITYEDLLTIGEEIYEKTGVQTKGINTSTHNVEHATDISRALGGHFWDEIASGDTANIERYFEYAKMYDESDAFISYEKIAENSGAVEDDFLVTGECWNTTLSSNQFVAVQNVCDFNLGITYFYEPEDAVVEPMYIKASMLLCVAENSEHKQEAAEFIDWFTNSTECNEILSAERGVPVNSEVQTYMKGVLDEANGQVFDYVNDVAGMVSMTMDAYPVGATEVTSLLVDLLDDVYYGDKTPEEAAAQLVEEGASILEEAAK